MACAAMVRVCVFRNSYITVVISPGCTSRCRTAGLNSHGPAALASNSTEIVRERSTCEFNGRALELPGTWLSEIDSTLIPKAVQIDLYIGTSAYPNPNINSATTASLRTMRRLSPSSWVEPWLWRGGCSDIKRLVSA